MSVVHVAVGVIVADDGKIFLSKRPADVHQGNLWEFPGGKVELGETVLQALRRELQEELGIVPVTTQPLLQVKHDYGDKSVLLDVHTVWCFRGEPHGREGQSTAWVTVDNLPQYDFPAANRPILQAVMALN